MYAFISMVLFHEIDFSETGWKFLLYLKWVYMDTCYVKQYLLLKAAYVDQFKINVIF